MKANNTTEKFIVVTGGSGGIGEAIAKIFSPSYTVLLHYHNSIDNAKRIESDLKQNNGKVHLIKADLANEKGCLEFFNTVRGITDRIDILVNNSGGIIKRHAVGEIGWDLIQKHFELNTFSTILLSSLFVPLLEKGIDPSVINITSGSIRQGGPTATLYAASKGAVDVFTRGMALEMAPNIRINAIAPGVIDTNFQKNTPDERLKSLILKTPLNRLGTAHDVAQTALFLSQSTFTTGETIDVNGGLLMR